MCIKLTIRSCCFLDLFAIPDFAAGAMENWGLITYRETALLYDPESTSSADKQWVGVVIAHELAHQVNYYTMLSSYRFVCHT